MRKSEKQKGDNRKKNDRPSIPIELPIPRKKKKRKEKKYFYSGRTIVRRLLHSPARRVMLSRHRLLRARPLNRGWQKNGETNSLKEKEKEREREREREREKEKERRVRVVVYTREKEKERMGRKGGEGIK